jgi:hypothetical protein
MESRPECYIKVVCSVLPLASPSSTDPTLHHRYHKAATMAGEVIPTVEKWSKQGERAIYIMKLYGEGTDIRKGDMYNRLKKFQNFANVPQNMALKREKRMLENLLAYYETSCELLV